MSDHLTNAAKALGSKGGKHGGPARAVVLTKQAKVDIARQGGKASAKARRGLKMPKRGKK